LEGVFNPVTIWALHGFLGLPSDFDSVQQSFQNLQPQVNWNSLNYLKRRELSPENSLEVWGKNLNDFVSKQNPAEEKRWLVGYSQGGRLALHALKENPRMWSGAVLISAGPGLTELEKRERAIQDREWAERFLNDPFEATVTKWNAQSVFQGSKNEPRRQEQDFNRRQLADCLLHWSIAKQESLFSFLKNPPGSILYLAGENDLKYVQIGQYLAHQSNRIHFEKVPDAGHRVIVDQPARAAELIKNYLFP
jgi:2-succinyl-6-hydroxy-2,4-cyclohexadiene-1-carboxylate synthase